MSSADTYAEQREYGSLSLSPTEGNAAPVVSGSLRRHVATFSLRARASTFLVKSLSRPEHWSDGRESLAFHFNQGRSA